jgi:hypothetical protein
MPDRSVPMVAGLSARQVMILVGLGAVLWFAAALLLGLLAPHGIYEGWGRVILYAAIVPGTWPFVLLLARAAGLRGPDVFTGVAVALAAATLLDGIALAWAPTLYGETVEHVAGAGAAILWGAGVFLVLGAIASRAPGEGPQ